MGKKRIPQDVREEVDELVGRFNLKVIKDPDYFYVTRYRGTYLYLDRNSAGRPSPVCRLEYTGTMNSWRFAIYKYSDEMYDPGEMFFYGAEHVDGSVIGALQAGLEAYP
jgi:hypothetical protein